MSDLMCDEPLEWHEDVVTISGSPAFLHTLRLNPSLRDAYDDAFGGEAGLFAAIFNTLLRPRAEIVADGSRDMCVARLRTARFFWRAGGRAVASDQMRGGGAPCRAPCDRSTRPEKRQAALRCRAPSWSDDGQPA